MDKARAASILRAMNSDVMIVGGGLNGPMLALAVARAGLCSTVADTVPRAARVEDGFDGRSYAIAQGSKRMLAALGLWERLAPTAQPMHEIKVSDGRVSDAAVLLGLHFDSAEIEDGPMGFMVEDRHLRRALLEAMDAEPKVTHQSETRVVAQDIGPAQASVTFESGETHAAKLLVGADGRGSGVAARAGIKRTSWGYGQTALVCAIAHELPHHGVAHQLFLPPGPLAILPLTENRASLVWSETAQTAAAYQALPDAQYLQILQARIGDFLGSFTLAGGRYTYPLGLTLAQRFVDRRVALVGDAAHGVHPIAGQGLNAGLRDVAALAQVLSEAAQRGEDIGAADVLARYQSWRRFDTATLAAATDLFNRLFSNDSALLRGLRDLGMGLVNKTPGLRRAFIREAAGLSGDLPELMRG